MKNLLLLFVCLLFTVSTSYAQTKKRTSSGPNYKTLSINYVASKLKSPGSAELVDYSNVNDTRKILINSKFNLSDCTKVTRVVVDSQNGFGAFIRGYYFVFFKNGKPCHMEESESIISAARSGNRTDILYIALDMNNCDCSK